MSKPDALIGKLRNVVARPETVFLVGSGLSCSAGLPTWGDLLDALAGKVDECGGDTIAVRRLKKNGDYLSAADLAASQLTARDLGAVIRRACRSDTAQPAEVHRALVRVGPTCFVTTNYDQLIERAIEEYRPNERPRVVTNRQTPDITDIMAAHARNFVFKYHGDVMDTESIVLSREQYRKMSGEFRAVVEAMKSILSTRPVVILGFSMKDPDFMAIQDLLISVFSGHAGEHYAILADNEATDVERSHWKRKYNVDIIGYPTNPDRETRHAKLVDLLRDLRRDTPVRTDITTSPGSHHEQLLKWMRLAARAAQLRPKNAIELPLKVRSRSARTGKTFSNASKTWTTLPELLRTHAKGFVLTGDPGIGKSFALKTHAAEVGAALHAACAEDAANLDDKPIALYVDLASYAGDLRALLREQLPAGMSLDDISGDRPCTLLLDSVNEIPREHLDSGRWEADLLELVNTTSGKPRKLVLGVRDGHPMTRLNLPVYSVDGIEESFVREYFRARRLPAISERADMVNLFAKPSFFSLAYHRIIDVDRVIVARDVYASLFDHVGARWAVAAHASRSDLVALLSNMAFDAIRAGREAIPVIEVRERCASLRGKLRGDEIIEFLVAQGVLVARPGLHVSFFHQSVTEFLAAIEIADRCRQSTEILQEILHDRRWDHAALFALSSLPRDAAAELFNRILALDIVLALRATQFVRDGRNTMIASVLREVSLGAEKWTADNDLEHMLDVADALTGLHAGPEHRTELEKLARKGGPLGGVATGLLFALNGDEGAVISLLNQFDDDYGFITSLVDAVRERAGYPFVHMLVYWVRENYLPNASRSRRRRDGISRIGELIQVLDPNDAEKLVQDFIGSEGYVREVLYEGLKAWDSAFARSCLARLVKSGACDAAWALHTNLTYYSDRALPSEFEVDSALADAIVRCTGDPAAGHWALHLCRSLTAKNPGWRDALMKSAAAGTPLLGRMLIEVFVLDDERRITQNLELLVDSFERLSDSQRVAVGRSRSWRTLPPEAAFPILLTENCRMAEGVLSTLGGGVGRTAARPFSHKPLAWWLQWMERCEGSNDELHRTCAHRIGAFLAKSDWTTNRLVLQHFNRPDISESAFRMMGKHIVAQMADVSTLSLSDSTLRRLLDGLGRTSCDDEMGRPLLGVLATESFVVHHLLPLAARRDLGPAAQLHLRRVLDVAGRRHGRRYAAQRH